MAAVQVEGLSVVYRSSRGPQTALAELDLGVRAGEFVCVLGPSGCGKSTLLSIVGGLIKPSSGRVAINGQPVKQPRPDVGIVFQRPTLLPWASVLDNVLVPVTARGRVSGSDRERAQALLELAGLARFANHYPDELSGGMQQRVGIVRALINEPDVLLMDEPFAALDAMTREHMSLELQRIWGDSGKTVLFITHSIPEAVFLADRIVVMTASPGRVLTEVAVPLARPRTLVTMSSPDYAALCGEVRALFNTSSGVPA